MSAPELRASFHQYQQSQRPTPSPMTASQIERDRIAAEEAAQAKGEMRKNVLEKHRALVETMREYVGNKELSLNDYGVLKKVFGPVSTSQASEEELSAALTFTAKQLESLQGTSVISLQLLGETLLTLASTKAENPDVLRRITADYFSLFSTTDRATIEEVQSFLFTTTKKNLFGTRS